MRLEEKIIIREIRNRNRAVFEKVFHDYYALLVRFAEGYLFDLAASEDIVQTFFLKIWSNAAEFEVNSSLKSYLLTSVQNLCLNRIRDLKVYDKYKLLYLETMLNVDEAEVSEEPDILHQLENAIASLPPKMALIFRLKYYSDSQVKDIAKELAVSEGTVKTQLHRARNLVRTFLKIKTGCYFFL